MMLVQKIKLLWIRLLLVCSILSSLHVQILTAEDRRPIYIIAHMVNSIYELDEYIERGANAIESDVTFHQNGTVKDVFHGYPCDCYRVCDEKENFAVFLNHIRDLANPKSQNYHKSVTLLFLDLKISEVSKNHKYQAGEEIAKYLITHLWNNDRSDPKINVLLSIGHTSESDVFKGVQDTFTKSHRDQALKKLGFDVGMNDDLNSIRTMWSNLGIKSNRWQGDGITNCFRPLRDDDRLRHALRIRDSDNGFIEKVYDWTVDITPNIRRSLRSGVDGMLTNFPERVISVIQENEFKERFRLATAEDDPFSRIHMAPVKSTLRPPTMNTYVSALREITIAVMGYVWDFYKLRLKRPATLFPLIQEIFSRGFKSRRYRKPVRASKELLRKYRHKRHIKRVLGTFSRKDLYQRIVV